MGCFNCSRTCRTQAVDSCRFLPLFVALGSHVVNSHTTAVKVEFRDMGALRSVVERLGGRWLGEGVHTLYGSNREEGHGFTLPGWRHTLVAQRDALKFDPWGNTAAAIAAPTISREYVYATARKAAAANRWSVISDTPSGLVLRHPTGGKLTVRPDGTCDAVGFCGSDCHASSPIEDAIGARGARSYKPEAKQRVHLKR